MPRVTLAGEHYSRWQGATFTHNPPQQIASGCEEGPDTTFRLCLLTLRGLRHSGDPVLSPSRPLELGGPDVRREKGLRLGWLLEGLRKRRMSRGRSLSLGAKGLGLPPPFEDAHLLGREAAVHDEGALRSMRLCMS